MRTHINDLPPEIRSHAFRFGSVLDAETARSLPITPSEYNFSLLPFAQLTSRVCSLWRQDALADPRLWVLNLCISSSLEETWRTSIRRFQEQAAASLTCDVHLHVADNQAGPNLHLSTDPTFALLMNFVGVISHRLRTFEVETARLVHAYTALHSLNPARVAALPRLEILDLKTSCQGLELPRSIESDLQLAPIAPNLQKLSLKNMALNWDVATLSSSLLDLSINTKENPHHPLTPENLAVALQQTPSLQTLTMSINSDERWLTYRSLDNTAMHHLNSVIFYGHISVFSKILGTLDLPALESATLYSEGLLEGGFSALNLQARVIPSLRTLSIHNVSADEISFLRSVTAPSLESLKLAFVYENYADLPLLLLPTLRNLKLVGSDTQISAFLQLLDPNSSKDITTISLDITRRSYRPPVIKYLDASLFSRLQRLNVRYTPEDVDLFPIYQTVNTVESLNIYCNRSPKAFCHFTPCFSAFRDPRLESRILLPNLKSLEVGCSCTPDNEHDIAKMDVLRFINERRRLGVPLKTLGISSTISGVVRKRLSGEVETFWG